MTTRTAPKNKPTVGFSAEELAAMKDHAQELGTAARRGARATKADGTADVLAKFAEMGDADRALAERIHAIVTEHAPQLTPKLWYGMPAYAKDGKIVCFFKSAEKFKSRYATLGFEDKATLDAGTVWPTSFAITGLTPADEQMIGALVAKAAS
ncbi:iron chaperone [Nocardia sp. CA-128927]|uniref:iron chaperone n=1 Tax=Nocardia sp. CA-128927 TaxID=3239975 RepID=UPI003D99D1BE